MTREWEDIASASDPEDWIKNLTERWMTTYLAALERRRGKEPRYWGPVQTMFSGNEAKKWSEDLLPCLIVVNAGLVGDPERLSNGQWNAVFSVGCAIFCAGTSRENCNENAKAYAAAFRSMMLQHTDLEVPERCGGISWKDERYTDVSSDGARTIMAATSIWEVEVLGLTFDNDIPGPNPPDDPYAAPGEHPTILTGDIDITPVRELS